MGIYESEIKKNTELAKKWNKRMRKWCIYTPIIIFILTCFVVNIIASMKIKEAEELVSLGQTEQALYQLDCPLQFLIIDKNRFQFARQEVTTAYLPTLIGEIDNLQLQGNPEQTLQYIEEKSNYLSPNTVLYDKATVLFNAIFGNQLQQALQTNDPVTIKDNFNIINDTHHSVLEQLYLENILMERVVVLFNNNQGEIALSILDEFDGYFDKVNNQRIDSFKDNTIKLIEHDGDFLMQEDSININNQDTDCTYFSDISITEQASKANLYFSYYVTNDDSLATNIKINTDSEVLFEKNATIQDGIQNPIVPIQDRQYSIQIHANGANFFYLYEYTPINSYATWMQENNPTQ